jgi:hypothetical protein
LKRKEEHDHSSVLELRAKPRPEDIAIAGPDPVPVFLPCENLFDVPVAGPVYDDEDHLVKAAGETITPEEFDEIREGGFILGVEWWPTIESAQAECASSDDSRESTKHLVEFERTELITDARIRILDEHDQRELIVTTQQIAPDGVSFWSKHYIAQGATLSIEVKIFNDQYRLQGQVASVKFESGRGGGAYHLYVVFTKSLLELNPT